MRTTINIDDDLLAKAAKADPASGSPGHGARGTESAKRLARLGGT